jgi:hypothetical protein
MIASHTSNLLIHSSHPSQLFARSYQLFDMYHAGAYASPYKLKGAFPLRAWKALESYLFCDLCALVLSPFLAPCLDIRLIILHFQHHPSLFASLQASLAGHSSHSQDVQVVMLCEFSQATNPPSILWNTIPAYFHMSLSYAVVMLQASHAPLWPCPWLYARASCASISLAWSSAMMDISRASKALADILVRLGVRISSHLSHLLQFRII